MSSKPIAAFDQLIAAAHAAAQFAQKQFTGAPSTAYADSATHALRAATETLVAAKALRPEAFELPNS